MSDKYAAIRADRGRYPVRLMCAALQVSVSGFYAAARRPTSARITADETLRVQVRTAHAKSRRRYGAPRVHRQLLKSGMHIGKKRVARLMHADGLVARPAKRFVCTTDSQHGEPLAANLLARRFAVSEARQVDQVWTSDITYVPTRQGWLYLAVVLDLSSRRVVGWAMRETLDQELALAALRMAVADRQPAPGLLHHADRGSQYAGRAYRGLLATHGMVCSMSRKGDCWDNAVTESFFATLEHELLAMTDFHSRHEARRAIFEFIEVWYNRERMHSTLGYLSPVDYEALQQAA